MDGSRRSLRTAIRNVGEAALFRRRALRATEDKDAERSERRVPGMTGD